MSGRHHAQHTAMFDLEGRLCQCHHCDRMTVHRVSLVERPSGAVGSVQRPILLSARQRRSLVAWASGSSLPSVGVQLSSGEDIVPTLHFP